MCVCLYTVFHKVPLPLQTASLDCQKLTSLFIYAVLFLFRSPFNRERNLFFLPTAHKAVALLAGFAGFTARLAPLGSPSDF